ncbi:MAG: hypothetical protein D6717_10015 [Gammaproteobacteria bacterium]|nr:MAG: hypothetical protein D6717_10015 [Gammaproteobacteria bacterium]
MSTPYEEQTADGSPTLYHPDFAQTYHSRHGAVTEARHVFLDQGGVAERLRTGCPTRVLEVGFGLGLNCLLGADLAVSTGTDFEYTGLECRLLPRRKLAAMDYARWLQHPELARWLLDGLPEDGAQSGRIALSRQFVSLSLILGDAVCRPWSGPYEAIWLDAFSPDANPELWTTDFLAALADALAPGGCLSTYSARGAVRRALQAAGLEVHKRPGPPGKREMLVAFKSSV